MIDDCRIRPFEAGDLPRLHEIREAAFRPVFRSFRALVGEEIAAVAFAHARGFATRNRRSAPLPNLLLHSQKGCD